MATSAFGPIDPLTGLPLEDLTVKTDQEDYAPGSTAYITATGFNPGSTIEFAIQDAPNDPGDDGIANIYTPFYVTDGGEGDLDGVADGNITTTWFVPSDPDGDGPEVASAMNATLHLTATGNGTDATFGTADDQVATTTFTDAGGSYSISWRAADPETNKGSYLPSYDKITPTQWLLTNGSYPTGRADNPLANSVAYASPATSSNLDAVASLAPKNMALGQIVPFQVEITVNGSTTAENGVIEFTPYWLTKTTNGADFGFDPNYRVVAAFVDARDAGTSDPGNNAKVDSFTSSIANAGTSNEQIQSNIRLSGLENGDKVIVEIWVVLKDTIPAGSQGNVQTGLVGAKTATGDTISTGNQTVPLLRVQEFFSQEADLSVIKSDNPTIITAGDDASQVFASDTLTYTIVAKNNSTSTIANDVTVVDTLDPNVTFVPGSIQIIDSQGFVTTPTNFTYDPVTGKLTGDLGYLLQQEEVTIKFNVTVNPNAPTAGTADVNSTVTITSIAKDPNTANNTNSEATDVINPPPVDGNESVTTLEDTVISGNVLTNATDPNNDPVSVTQFVVNSTTYSAGQTATLAGVGTLVIGANGSYTFTPAANYNGAVPVATYTVSDGKGGTDTSTLAIAITPVNDAPTGTATASLAAGTEDTAYIIKASDLLAGFSDVDADKLSVSGLTANNGTITANTDGSYTFTPNANYNGTINLSYNVIDNNGGTVTATQSFNLAAVNDAPTGAASAKLVAGTEDIAYTIKASDLLAGFSDIDGDKLSVSGLSANNGTIKANTDGSYTFTPDANYNSTVSLTYDVIDGNGGMVAATQSFSITPVNDAPTGMATGELANSTEDTAYTISVTDLLQGFSDIDGDKLSVSGLSANNGIIKANTGGSYTFTPDANYNGTVSLTYDVIDSNGGTVTATQSFNLAAVNDAPTGTATVSLAAGTEDTAYTIKAADLLTGFSDVDAGDKLSVDNLKATNGSLVNNNDGTYSFTPAENYNGSVELTYDVIDGNGGKVAATQSFSITPVNDAPTGTATASLAAGTEDTAYIIKASDLLTGFSDVDADKLSVSGLTANNGTITANTDGSYTFTPNANYNGTVNLSYNVIDNNGGTVAATQSFSITPVNDAPTGTATASLAGGTEDTAYTIKAADLLAGFSDVDAGDKLSVDNLKATNGSLVNNNDGTYSFTPAENYNGSVELTYDVIDGNGGTVTATQSFNLAAVNDAPTGMATASVAGGTEDSTYIIKASDLLTGFSDIDGDKLSVSQLKATNGSLLENNDGTWTFTPAANYNGSVNLSYNVIDHNGGTVTATQSFNLAAVNDAPMDANEFVITLEDTPISGNLLTNATDPDNNPLSVTQFVVNNTTYIAGQTATLTGIGTLIIDINGGYTFTPAANYNGSVPVATYTVSDGTATDTSTLAIGITPVNDAPLAVNDTLFGTQNTPLTITSADLFGADSTGMVNDYDIDSANFSSITVTTLATNGTLLLNGTAVSLNQVITTADIAANKLTFTPNSGFSGAASFNYTVSDGALSSNQATVTINMAPVKSASGPGVGTPGFWQNNTAVWDGNTSNDSTFNTKSNYAKADILYQVTDPVTGTRTTATNATASTNRGILIGDFNKDGLTNPGERTIYYSVAEARDILNASVSGDSRYTIAKHLISSWLNVLAGNEYTQIQTDINNGIQWLQNSTPAETGKGAGGKDKMGDGSLTLNAASWQVSSSDPRWSTSLGSVSGTQMHYGSQINDVLDYYNNTGAGFANDRDTGAIGGDLSTLTSLQAYQSHF